MVSGNWLPVAARGWPSLPVAARGGANGNADITAGDYTDD